MIITVLYTEDCPHWKLAVKRVQEAMMGLGVDAELRIACVRRNTEESVHGFAGSPTILIDGVDHFGGSPTPLMACRLYDTENGREGAPSVSRIMGAVRASRQGSRS